MHQEQANKPQSDKYTERVSDYNKEYQFSKL
jgi:hypothetical protein